MRTRYRTSMTQQANFDKEYRGGEKKFQISSDKHQRLISFNSLKAQKGLRHASSLIRI